MTQPPIRFPFGTLAHHVTDHLGTPALSFDQAGVEVWEGGFEPFGADYSGAQNAEVFLRFPGQWNDSSWDDLFSTESGMYYNVHRWYEFGTGRYTRPDPLGLDGGQNLFAYASGNPATYIDPLGEAYFAKRPLGPLPWMGPGSCNPIDDYLNTELSHEQLFFEDGKAPSNLGFFDDGTVRPEPNPEGYRCRSRRFSDCIMRKAVKQTPVQPYCLLGKPGPLKKFNCQDWAERVRDEYRQLEKDPKTKDECGCD